jgi:hypothetical protein
MANYQSVKNFWAHGTGDQHHPENVGPRAGRCPSAQLWPMPCRCEFDSITAKMNTMTGAFVIMAPMNLLGNWAKEWHKFVALDDLPSKYRPILASGHSQALKNYAPTLRDCLKKHAICPENTESALGEWKYSLEEKAKKTPISFYIPWHEDWAVLPRSMHRLVILTTSHSFGSHVKNQFLIPFEHSFCPPTEKKPRLFKTKAYWGAYSTIIIDEAHREKGIQSTQIRVLQDLSRSPSRPFIWALSGTFVQTGPQDVAGYCAALRGEELNHTAGVDSWSKDKELEPMTSASFMEADKKFKNYMSAARVTTTAQMKPQQMESYRQTVQKLHTFLRRTMIARHERCLWPDTVTAKRLGIEQKKCQDVPAVMLIEKEGENKLSTEMEQKVLQVERKLKQEIEVNLAMRKSKLQALRCSKHGQLARLCGTLPFLALYNNLALVQRDMKDIQKNKSDSQLPSSVVLKHADACWKLGQLSQLIRTRLGPSKYHPGRRKMVVVSRWPVLAHTIHHVSSTLQSLISDNIRSLTYH